MRCLSSNTTEESVMDYLHKTYVRAIPVGICCLPFTPSHVRQDRDRRCAFSRGSARNTVVAVSTTLKLTTAKRP